MNTLKTLYINMSKYGYYLSRYECPPVNIQCPFAMAGTSSVSFMKSFGLRKTPTKWVSQFDLLSIMPVWVNM